MSNAADTPRADTGRGSPPDRDLDLRRPRGGGQRCVPERLRCNDLVGSEVGKATEVWTRGAFWGSSPPVKHWGLKPFDNDVAQAFAVAIIAGGEMESVLDALELDADDFIDADVGQRALAAAEIIAALRGGKGQPPELPPQLRRWVMRQARPTPLVFKRARRALKLIGARTNADNSALRHIYGGQLRAWGVVMRDLLKRLHL